jgi:voltage-gated potassium channel
MNTTSSSQSLGNRLIKAVSIFSFIILAGTGLFMWIEKWPAFDALYMTIITITTVGFGEIRPLSQTGRIVTISLVVLGVGAFTYTFGTIAEYIVAGEFRGMLEQRRRRAQISKMNDHIIVCGFGRVGQQVATELSRAGVDFVVIDSKPASVERARESGYLVIEGNAGADEILRSAGILLARGLIASVNSDADNLLITLSARALSPNLYIITRANYEETEGKMRIAGANRVISPYSIAGHRMAEMLLRPDIVDFLDVIMNNEELELWLENLTIAAGCELEDCTIGDARVRETTGANILAVKKIDGRLLINLDARTVLAAGDVLMALGTRSQLGELAKKINPA